MDIVVRRWRKGDLLRLENYYSRKTNYNVYKLEGVAVLYAFKTVRAYIIGNTFILKTASIAARYILENKDQSEKLLRCSLKIQDYNFKIEHKPCKHCGS